ncbi:unnamed protein product [Cunninghamella blakesleeana]
MEPKLYSIPFEVIVPEDIKLPSTMDFNKKVKVKYTLVAIHDKPMVPESLCPKVEYPVHILDFIDTEDEKLQITIEKLHHTTISNLIPEKVCNVHASIPKYGFTRGDIIPLSIVINHCEVFALPKAIEINLIRIIEVRNNKTNFKQEDILTSVHADLYIKSPSTPSQTIKRQLLIPSSTPPSIQFRDDLLRIEYKVRVTSQLVLPGTQNKPNEGISIMNLPVIVGTWPRASIPIDDDDDDDNNNDKMNFKHHNDNNEETSQEIDFLNIESPYIGSDILDNNSIKSGRSSDYQHNNNDMYLLKHNNGSKIISNSNLNNNNHYQQSDNDHQQLTLSMSSHSISDSHSSNSSNSTIRLKTATKSPTTPNFNAINRSDSITSKSSNKSYTSYSSWENSSMSLSRNTSLSTTVSKAIEGQNQSRVETIMMQPASSSSSPVINNSSNISSSSSSHRSSADPAMTGLVHPLSINSRQSSLSSEQMMNNGSIISTNLPSPTFSQNSSSSNNQRQNSIAFSVKSNESNNYTIYSPTRTVQQSFSSSDLSFPRKESIISSSASSVSLSVSSAIMLQPVDQPASLSPPSVLQNDNVKSYISNPPPVTKKTIHFNMNQEKNKTNDDSDDSDDDDSDSDSDDDDPISAIKKKEKQDKLNERNRLYMTEMTA